MFTRALSYRLPRPEQGPLARITHLHAMWRSRRALATLSDSQLADVGLTRTAADQEAARPFWDAPAGAWDAPRHWRC